MVFIYWTVLTAFLIIWLMGLRSCWKSQRFAPVIGSLKATRIFWLLTFLFFNPLIVILYFFCNRAKKTDKEYINPSKPRLTFWVVSAIIILGFFVRFPGLSHLWAGLYYEGDPNSRFNLSMATSESKNNKSSFLAYSGQGVLPWRKIAIVCNQDYHFAEVMVHCLEEVLEKKFPEVEIITFDLKEDIIAQGKMPDVFICLNCNGIKTTLSGLSGQLSCIIDMDLYHDDRVSRDNYPFFMFMSNVEIVHDSTTVGYESVKHTLASKSLAEQIAGDLQNIIKDKRHVSALPSYFYGKYKNVELPRQLNEYGPSMMAQWERLLSHGQTVWKLKSGSGTQQERDELVEKFKADGWKKRSVTDEWVSLKKGNLRLVIGEITFAKRVGPDNKSVDTRNVKDGLGNITVVKIERPDEPFVAIMYERFSKQEHIDVFSRAIENNEALDSLLLFDREKFFTDELRGDLYEKIEVGFAINYYSLLRIAEYYCDKDKDKSRRFMMYSILRAKLDNKGNKAGYKKKFAELAEKIGLVDIDPSKLTEQVCLESGMPVLKVGEPVVFEDFSLGQTIYACYVDDEGYNVVYCRLFRQNGSLQRDFGLIRNNGKIWSSGAVNERGDGVIESHIYLQNVGFDISGTNAAGDKSEKSKYRLKISYSNH